MIIWPMSPPVCLTLGFAQVNLPAIFVCAPAMTAIPQSSAGTKITFRMTTSGEEGGNYRTFGRSAQFCARRRSVRKNVWWPAIRSS
jgi:hypothetical protein